MSRAEQFLVTSIARMARSNVKENTYVTMQALIKWDVGYTLGSGSWSLK